jgi:pimeloyl-ACP methyl ester carboxylesterase
MTAPAALTSVPARPFFFGAPDTRLFGCFHPAAAEATRTTSVLICGPCGHEYMASHRALRQLAVRLAQAGFATLRFDWYGLGDSSGASDAGTLAQWRLDLVAARQELLQLTPGRSIATIGVRLGAALALETTARACLERVVLWDPVVSGRRWIAGLPGNAADGRQEHLTVTLSPALCTELEQLDLERAVPGAPEKLLVVPGPDALTDSTALFEALGSRGTQVEQRQATYPPGWLDPGSAVVPAAAIQAITKWFSERTQ